MKKLLIVCGPTATGKTKLGIRLAKKYNGEIVSADSRQVYKEMDIITGKDLPVKLQIHPPANGSKAQSIKKNLNFYLFKNIPVWGLDLITPDQEFSVAHFVKFADKVINNIWEKGKLPIIVGGSGFWIKTLLKGSDSIKIPPDWKLRKQLNKLSTKQLREKLKKLTPERWEKMNRSDRNNPRRLIRAIEINKSQKLKVKSQKFNSKPITKDIFIVGLKTKDYKNLYQKIDKRVDKRIKKGAEKEIKDLIKQGYSWDLPSFSASGYRLWKDYFEKRKNIKETIQSWKFSEHKLARGQIVFFKKMKNITWFDINQTGVVKRIEKKVRQWYSVNC